MSDCSFTQRGVFSISMEVVTTLSWLLHGRWCHVKLLPSRRAFCVGGNTYNHASRCYSKPHTYNECMFSLTCHLHVWQNDRDLLRAAVRQGWNGYRNKSQHRKLTPEKNILPPLQPGIEPAPFRSRVRRSTTEPSRPHSQKYGRGWVVGRQNSGAM